MYEYYLNGPAEWVTEWVRSGAEAHIQIDKRSRYQAAGVPELTILDVHCQQVEFLRLVDGIYQPQYPKPSGHYNNNITSIPGLTLLTDRRWPTRFEFVLLREQI
jgi:Putative restriction endonuclease